MRKISTLAIALALPFSLLAQSSKPIDGSAADRFGLISTPLAVSDSPIIRGDFENVPVESRAGGPIWEETFGNGVNTSGDTIYTDNGGWVRQIGDGAIWKYSTTPSEGCWSTGTTLPSFSTVGNGFLMFDADSVNCQDPSPNPPIFTQDILFGSVVSPLIDLSATPAVALSFEYDTRWCCNEQLISVAFSPDGGVNWSNEQVIESPTIVNENLESNFAQNVSNFIGGSSMAMIRFTWSAASHYYLAIDDIQLTLPPADDVRMNYAAVSHNNTAEEYGRIPVDQMQSTITIGAEVYNFGSTSQTNLELAIDFETGGSSVFTGTDSEATLASLDTVTLEDMPSISGLVEGDYTGTFVVTSDNDTAAGGTFSNNELSRNFEITNMLYSIDGIGVHDQAQVSSLGTNSFTDAEDGFMMLTYYDISSTTTAIGLEIVLDDDTELGSTLVVSLHDTADVFVDDVTLFFAESDLYDVIQSDINGGTIQVMFDSPVELQPNAYFAGVEMFSNAGESIIRIVDDVTVPQPFYSTMIFIPNDAVYSNGNAAAIRLIAGPTASVGDDLAQEINLTVYPNPSNGDGIDLVMRSAFNETVEWELIDIAGSLVSSGSFAATNGKNVERLNVAELNSGVYLVKVTSNNYYGTERIVIEK